VKRGAGRRQEKQSFAELVYRVVRSVPRGRVVTYGQVAALAGRPGAARAAGTALGALERPLLDIVPWHRVINSSGRTSHRDRFRAEIQREMLESEGIRFDARGKLDLAQRRWNASVQRRKQMTLGTGRMNKPVHRGSGTGPASRKR